MATDFGTPLNAHPLKGGKKRCSKLEVWRQKELPCKRKASLAVKGKGREGNGGEGKGGGEMERDRDGKSIHFILALNQVR